LIDGESRARDRDDQRIEKWVVEIGMQRLVDLLGRTAGKCGRTAERCVRKQHGAPGAEADRDGPDGDHAARVSADKVTKAEKR